MSTEENTSLRSHVVAQAGIADQTKSHSMRKFAGAAAIVVGVSSVLYGLIFAFFVPVAQKNAPPASLISYAHSPISRLVENGLLAVAGIAASAAVVGIYQRVREGNAEWALWSLVLGSAYSVLTALSGAYFAFLMVALSRIYIRGDAALKAGAVVAASMPSPLDPYDFAKYVLAGLWLLVTGSLMVRSLYFPRPLGYLAFVAGIGALVLFISTIAEQPPRSLITQVLILVTGLPGTLVLGPLFWLWTGHTLWTKSDPPRPIDT